MVRIGTRPSGGGGLAVLIDPGRTTSQAATTLAARAADAGAALLLIGNSFSQGEETAAIVTAVRREAAGIPLAQFPATASQLVAGVDATLLLSLVSGRNAQYLIEEHVRAVPFFERHPEIEVVSTAYILIDGGTVTSAESVSQTRPLPAQKPELVRAHVRAAMLIGLQATYLDAGSGAAHPVDASSIRAAREACDGPLFVGGGVRGPEGVRLARDAGADYVVVGTLFETAGGRKVRDLAAAARS
jgi:putative glycerol-1-phosphate prenyltransferase